MVDIGMYALIHSNLVDMNGNHYLFTVSEAIRTSSSATRFDNESLHSAGMIVLGPKHQECNSSDVSGVAREISPSKGGRNVTSLNVGIDIVGEKPKHSGQGPHNAREVVRVNLLGEVFKKRNSSSDVVQDMSSRIERVMIDSNYGDPTVLSSRRRKFH